MIATQLGFPVALKIDSPDISHKSDVQGVALNIHNAVGVRDTYQQMVQNVARLQPGARINGVTIQNMSSHGAGARSTSAWSPTSPSARSSPSAPAAR
jgi:acetyltransferase